MAVLRVVFMCRSLSVFTQVDKIPQLGKYSSNWFKMDVKSGPLWSSPPHSTLTFSPIGISSLSFVQRIYLGVHVGDAQGAEVAKCWERDQAVRPEAGRRH